MHAFFRFACEAKAAYPLSQLARHPDHCEFSVSIVRPLRDRELEQALDVKYADCLRGLYNELILPCAVETRDGLDTFSCGQKQYVM